MLLCCVFSPKRKKRHKSSKKGLISVFLPVVAVKCIISDLKCSLSLKALNILCVIEVTGDNAKDKHLQVEWAAFECDDWSSAVRLNDSSVFSPQSWWVVVLEPGRGSEWRLFHLRSLEERWFRDARPLSSSASGCQSDSHGELRGSLRKVKTRYPSSSCSLSEPRLFSAASFTLYLSGVI